MDIKEFRYQYPEYDRVDDETLSKALHEKYYSHVPYTKFASAFGHTLPIKEVEPPQDVPKEPFIDKAKRVAKDALQNFEPDTEQEMYETDGLPVRTPKQDTPMDFLQAEDPTAQDKPDYGLRKDGTPKGTGFFGELKRPNGGVSTEISIGVEFDGKETEIPALVPTLSQDEIDYLLEGNKPTKDIVDKAVEHARKRIANGKSPFAKRGEQTNRTARQIAEAIKKVESSGDYKAKGGSGENGAYQFMPSTWEDWSAEYSGGTVLEMTPKNQDAVAEWKIQQWIDRGLSPKQIAAKWNSGSAHNWENKKGVNKYGVAYDVPKYVSKVMAALTPATVHSKQAKLQTDASSFWEDTVRSLKNVGAGSGAALNRGLAAFSDNLDKLTDYVAEKTGLKKGGAFEQATEELAENAEWWESKVKDPTLVEEITSEFVGGAGPGMAEFMLNVPYEMLLGAVDSGAKGAVERGAKRWLLGKILHSANQMKVAPRTTAMGAVGAVEAAAAGGDARDIAKSAGVMAGFGATAGTRGKSLKEIRGKERQPKAEKLDSTWAEWQKEKEWAKKNDKEEKTETETAEAAANLRVVETSKGDKVTVTEAPISEAKASKRYTDKSEVSKTSVVEEIPSKKAAEVKEPAGGTSAAASTDSFANIPQFIEMPEIVQIAKGLMKGKYPSVKKKLRGTNWAGVFYPKGEGEIELKADIFKDPNQSAKTLAHEIGHLVDWLPDKDLKRGNILGRIASLKKHTASQIPGKPGSLGPLTDAEKMEFKREARKLKEKGEKWIDEEITKEIPVEPKDIMGIWNSMVDTKSINKDLYEYIQKLNTGQKKSIIKSAMKGLVPDEIKQLGTIIKEKTGKKIKVETEGIASAKDIEKKYKSLIREEIKRRALLERSVIMEELKKFTQEWKPFDLKADPKHTKYRFSGPELYADAISAVITNPGFLKAKAPHFYEGFFNYLENKPKVKEIYEKIQRDIKSGAIATDRVKNLREGFSKGEDNWAKSISDSWAELKDKDNWGTTFIDRYYSMIRRVRQVGEGNIPDHLNPRYKIEDMTYSGSESEGYLTDLKNKVIVPSEKSNITIEDIGEYLYHKRVSGERSELANPQGWTPELSFKRMTEMEKQYGPELKKAADNFNQIRKEFFIDKVKNSGMYGKDLLNKIVENEDYATFDVVDYMEGRYGREATGQIFAQIGTLKDIANPFTATILKDLQLMKAVNRNIAVKSVFDFMKNYFPEEIVDAERKWDANLKGKTVVDTKNPDMGTIVRLNNGKIEGHYVPKHIADSFQRNPVEGMLIAKILEATAKPFKAVFTELNPGFWLFNIARDYKRTARNLPKASLLGFLKHYVGAIKPSMRSVFGMSDKTVKEMHKGNMLISVADFRGDTPQDMQIERLLKRYSLKPSVWKSKVLKPFGQFFYGVSTLSRGIERIPKVAAYKYLKEKYPDLSKEQIAHIVRVKAGSPAFLRQGTGAPIYNNLFLFSNAIKEGWRGDIEAMKDSPATYAWKAAKYNVIPKMAMIAASMGLFGLGTKSLMDGASDYDKTNYIIVPLGATPNGKTVYLRIPQDETGRFIGGNFWKLFGSQEKEMWASLFDYMAGQAPTMHPMFDVATSVKEYLSGKNPYDYFRGRYALDDEVFKAGGSRANKAFAKYISDKLGGGIIHRFGSNRPDQVKTELEKIIGLPILNNTVGRFLKVSDYGKRETIRKDKEEIRSLVAKESLAAWDAIYKLMEGESLSKEEMVAIIKKADALDGRLLKAMAHKHGNVYVQEFISSQSNEEKMAVLKRMAKDNMYQQGDN